MKHRAPQGYTIWDRLWDAGIGIILIILGGLIALSIGVAVGLRLLA